MSFEPKVITKWQGLNTSIAPELIEDGEVRDIYNFRQEKFGKLVSRNGYVYGLFTKTDAEIPTGMGADSLRFHDAETEYFKNKGLVGIGELTTDGLFEFCDTDKFMVYAVRVSIAIEGDDDNWKLAYLFAPITGQYKNRIFTFGVTDFNNQPTSLPFDNPSYIYQRDSTAQGTLTEGRTTLYAPSMPYSLDGNFDHTRWIDSFLKMTQYRHSLVISDRTNGDTLIEDEYNLRIGQEDPAVEHSLRIRPNSLDPFDIDIVELDLRLEADEENHLTTPVETGMALYQFEVEEDTTKTTIDYAVDDINNIEKYEQIKVSLSTYSEEEPYNSRYGEAAVQAYIESVKTLWDKSKQISPIPLRIRQFLPSWTQNNVANTADRQNILFAGQSTTEKHPILEYNWNENKDYVFSNMDEVAPFKNLANEVKLIKLKSKNQENETVDTYASDVFIWEDVKLPYVPAQSKSGRFHLLTDKDKEFDRTLSGVPRIVEFETLDGRAKEVPLTAWRYRFVWDYGNGILSAPSTELLAPDLLWKVDYTDDTISDQTRLNVTEGDWEKSLGKFQDVGQLGSISTLPKMFDNTTGDLTDLGYFVWKIKDGLYYPEHKFGKQVDGDDKAAINALFTAEQKENISTILTVTGADTIEMKGYFGEALTVATPTIINTGANDTFRIEHTWNYVPAASSRASYFFQTSGSKPLSNLVSSPLIQINRIPLLVPLKPQASSATYNSLFDVNGKLRSGYLNNSELRSLSWTGTFGYSGDVATIPAPITQTFNYHNKILSKQFILSGYNAGINISPSEYEFRLDWFDGFTDIAAIIHIGLDTGLFIKNTETWYNPLFLMLAKMQQPTYTIGDGIHVGSYANLYNRTLVFDAATHFILNPITNPNDTYLKNNIGELVVSEQAVYNSVSRAENGIFLNFVSFISDNNNEALNTDLRISTLLRLANEESERLTAFKNDVPSEAQSRLILNGMVDITVIDNNEEVFWQSQYDVGRQENVIDKPVEFIDTLDYTETRYPNLLQNPIHPLPVDGNLLSSSSKFISVLDVDLNKTTLDVRNTDYYDDYELYHTDNVEAHVYLEGERLLAYEQLTSIFPSSFLFQAPRLGITIPANKIPKRAKKLRIYRSVATHNNSFDPNAYGLVEEVEIKRYTADNLAAGKNIGDPYVIDEDGNLYEDGLYYFDKIKDVNLDFDSDIEQSEALRKPIQSRFNIALNERMYYANLKQSTQPEPPRKSQQVEYAELNDRPFETDPDPAPVELAANKLHNTYFATFQALDADGNPSSTRGFAKNTYVQYAYAYEDVVGVLSQIKETVVIDPCLPNDNTTTQFNRGEVVLYYLPNAYNGSIKHLNIYRRTYTVPSPSSPTTDYGVASSALASLPYYKIGKVDEKSMGIFLDDNSNQTGTIKDLLQGYAPVENNYESGVMYSEPYRPDFIKQESFNEYRSGDGSQITGLASLYGNLIIAKEKSLHRVAVQAEDALPSRIDEISPDVGCIAPETFITVDNNLFFVSSQGIMVYDNNQLLNIDAKVNEEIRTYIRHLKEWASTDGDLSHYITAGYNPEYKELYFNFPQFRYPAIPKYNDAPDSAADFMQYTRTFEAHIYVFQIESKLWTKYKYTEDLVDPLLSDNPADEGVIHYMKSLSNALQNSRLYCTNTRGEMRSGDMLPADYLIGYNWDNEPDEIFTAEPFVGHTWAGVYIETPYDISVPTRSKNYTNAGEVQPYTSTDDILDNVRTYQGIVDAGAYPYDFNNKHFPYRRSAPVKVMVKTQFVTLNRETILKRINRITANIFSEGEITVGLHVNKHTDGDERVRNLYYASYVDFNPVSLTAESNPHPITRVDNTAIKREKNILTVIPEPTVTGTEEDYVVDDSMLKGISFSVTIESEMRTQINEITFYLRPIHVYLQ